MSAWTLMASRPKDRSTSSSNLMMQGLGAHYEEKHVRPVAPVGAIEGARPRRLVPATSSVSPNAMETGIVNKIPISRRNPIDYWGPLIGDAY